MAIVRNVGRGVIVGLSVALLLSLYSLLLYVLGRGTSSATHPEVSMALLVGSYLLAGVVGGGTAGLLSPLARSWWGAMLVGFISALPVYFLLQWAQDGWVLTGRYDAPVALSLLVGAPAGLIFRAIIVHVDPFGPLHT